MGFSKEELAGYNENIKNTAIQKYEEEIQKVIQYIREFGREQKKYIPIFTAGGYRTKEDLKHQLELGADGIQAVTGDIEEGLVFCGANAWKEDYISTVQEVMDRFR